VTYQVLVTATAKRLLQAVVDRRVRAALVDRMAALTREPEKQGKALGGELAGLRSVRAVGQRYRIIYKVERRRVIVFVLALGLRQEGGRGDVYALARKLLRQRLT
jgi:mRNA interferase RelE/StbE